MYHQVSRKPWHFLVCSLTPHFWLSSSCLGRALVFGTTFESRPADAGARLLLSLLLVFSQDSMSSSANCLTGCRALALRPRRGSSLATLKQCAFTSALRATPRLDRGDGSKQTLSTTSLCGLTRPHPLSLQKWKHVSQVTAVARYASGQASEPHDEELPSTPPFTAGPYSNLTIGVPKESYPGERRVAITPQVNSPLYRVDIRHRLTW